MNLSLYNCDTSYCEFLRQFDSCVPYVINTKEKRPFVGIVIEVNTVKYYAPLTSPKPKHLSMKNQVDFLKINHGKWGAINFNNMIPINDQSIIKVDLKESITDTKSQIDYKNLLKEQLSWCQNNKAIILLKSQNIYQIIINGKGNEQLVKRCCNFKLLEEKCIEYCKQHDFQPVPTNIKPIHSIKDKIQQAIEISNRKDIDK